ncbi:MAG: CBS domain-containing protein [Pseudomonadota bacterium]|nr:CBS domain-containing protein [Pseudomonadota bacterium]
MLVSTMLRDKGGSVATVRPDATVMDVVTRLKEERVGALVVSEDDHRVAGIVSERDVVRSLAAKGLEAMNLLARDIMTSRVITCSPNDELGALMRMMTEHRIRHLPVVEADVMCGIISIGDVVKNRVDELEHEAEALREYIQTG